MPAGSRSPWARWRAAGAMTASSACSTLKRSECSFNLGTEYRTAIGVFFSSEIQIISPTLSH